MSKKGITEHLNEIDSCNAQIKGLSAILTCKLKGAGTLAFAEEINEKAWKIEKAMDAVRTRFPIYRDVMAVNKKINIDLLSSGYVEEKDKISFKLNQNLEDVIAAYIFESIKANQSNKLKTARTLGISIQTVRKYFDLFLYHNSEKGGSQ